jgi:hypothetical protein
VLTDVLPGTAVYANSSTTQGSCTGTTTVTCSLGTIGPGAGATVQIAVKPNAAGQLPNEVRVTTSTADPIAANDTASTTTTVNNPRH